MILIFWIFPSVVLGSISDYCAHNVKCPILIIKNKKGEGEGEKEKEETGEEENVVTGRVPVEVLPSANVR